jgi:F plasmid transfer operon protein
MKNTLSKVGDTVIPVMGIVVIAVLAWALTQKRSEAATLRSEVTNLAEAVPTVFVGSQAPTLQLRFANGSTRRVGGRCPAAQPPTLLVFSLKRCAACEAIEPQWTHFAAEHPGVDVVVVESNGEPRQAPSGSRLTFAKADADSIVKLYGVKRVPAVVALDASCKVAAALTGSAGSRSVMNLITMGHGDAPVR